MFVASEKVCLSPKTSLLVATFTCLGRSIGFLLSGLFPILKSLLFILRRRSINIGSFFFFFFFIA